MRCEMCDGEISGAYWIQKRPVDRTLCLNCAYEDQKSSPSWHGETMVLDGDDVTYRADYSFLHLPK